MKPFSRTCAALLICTYGGQQSRFERITTPDETVGISPAWRRQGTGDLSGLS